MFGEILQKFAEKSPTTVMVRALLEQLLNAEKLDQWFEVTRQTQYTRDILFSSLVGLMLQVVCSAWQKTRLSSRIPFFAARASASGSCILKRLVAVEPRK